MEAEGTGGDCVAPEGGCSVGVFLATVGRSPRQEQLKTTMRMFAHGVECSGDAAVVVEDHVYRTVDVAVVFSEVRRTCTPIPLSHRPRQRWDDWKADAQMFACASTARPTPFQIGRISVSCLSDTDTQAADACGWWTPRARTVTAVRQRACDGAGGREARRARRRAP